MKLARVFAGRREAALLASPSVLNMAEILARRCRDEVRVRSAVASLARFRALSGLEDLEELLQRALLEPGLAERTLTRFAEGLSSYPASQVSTLAMGAKLWFRLNGVIIPWRPLSGASVTPAPVAEQGGVAAVILLALPGSGLSLAEFARLRIGDLGSLDSTGRLLPDLQAAPLAVQYIPRRGRPEERITFLTYQARLALLRWLEPASADGQGLNPARLLLTWPDGSPVSPASLARARRRGQALIQAGNNANVELCRVTGDFFRAWGMPGSRFTGPEELNGEEYF